MWSFGVFLGVDLAASIGVNEGSLLHKVLLTVVGFAAVALLRYGIVAVVRLLTGNRKNGRIVFWTRQVASLLALAGLIGVVVVVWLAGKPGSALPIGVVTAGLAVALQKVWTAFAGYLVLIRGRVYTVGDRVAIGDVRGDVMALGFLYTRVMEMGEPPIDGKRENWIGARQFTGRIVTITNDAVFNEPIFNYTRDFPFIWEEIVIPIKYGADRARAEEILLRAADPATRGVRSLGEEAKKKLEHDYMVKLDDLEPHVFYRLTDNWIELTLRFLAPEHGIRQMKDAMARKILGDLEEAGLEIASATYEIVGLPKLTFRSETIRSESGPQVLRPSDPRTA